VDDECHLRPIFIFVDAWTLDKQELIFLQHIHINIFNEYHKFIQIYLNIESQFQDGIVSEKHLHFIFKNGRWKCIHWIK